MKPQTYTNVLGVIMLFKCQHMFSNCRTNYKFSTGIFFFWSNKCFVSYLKKWKPLSMLQFHPIHTVRVLCVFLLHPSTYILESKLVRISDEYNFARNLKIISNKP